MGDTLATLDSCCPTINSTSCASKNGAIAECRQSSCNTAVAVNQFSVDTTKKQPSSLERGLVESSLAVMSTPSLSAIPHAIVGLQQECSRYSTGVPQLQGGYEASDTRGYNPTVVPSYAPLNVTCSNTCYPIQELHKSVHDVTPASDVSSTTNIPVNTSATRCTHPPPLSSFADERTSEFIEHPPYAGQFHHNANLPSNNYSDEGFFADLRFADEFDSLETVEEVPKDCAITGVTCDRALPAPLDDVIVGESVNEHSSSSSSCRNIVQTRNNCTRNEQMFTANTSCPLITSPPPLLTQLDHEQVGSGISGVNRNQDIQDFISEFGNECKFDFEHDHL